MDDITRPDVVPHRGSVTRERRERQGGHRSLMLWFTGLPQSGKSTLAHEIEERLFREGRRTMVLDGDNVRHGLCADLGFSPAARAENLRRIAEMGKLFLEAGVIVLAAFVSPSRAERERVRSQFAAGEFLEIFCDCPAEECERRDAKGMYARARRGDIPDFTGVSAPYEAPLKPDLVLHTDRLGVEECTERVIAMLRPRLAL